MIFGFIKLPDISHAEGGIKVFAAKLTSERKSDVLISSGILFAPGQLDSEKNFSIFDANGTQIPIAARVLARWPDDNSIRSLLVQFPLKIEHNYKPVIIQWGFPRKSKDIAITEVKWILPEAILLLPAEWLCDSKVIGDQVPWGKHSFPGYDRNIEKYYPAMRDAQLTGDVSEDVYYSTPHVFYQLYVRTGDDNYFKSARVEAVRYRNDILKTGPNRGRHRDTDKTRFIYVEAMIDDYLLTGDEESLKIAGYMAEYLKNHFKPSEAFYSRKSQRFWTEREAAFPFLGAIDYYELTRDKDYLKYCDEIMQNLYKTQNEWPGRGGFIHNLYSHDPEEGARRDEYGGSPFMTGLLLEAIIKYHSVTNSVIAKDSIIKALDWLIKEGLTPDGRSFIYLTCDARKAKGHPDLNLLIAHAFGYGYTISGREDYLIKGTAVFEEGVKNAYLEDRKHFNQNYRSSGHFLAYIEEK